MVTMGSGKQQVGLHPVVRRDVDAEANFEVAVMAERYHLEQRHGLHDSSVEAPRDLTSPKSIAANAPNGFLRACMLSARLISHLSTSPASVWHHFFSQDRGVPDSVIVVAQERAWYLCSRKKGVSTNSFRAEP
jgi:hypothetical protein